MNRLSIALLLLIVVAASACKRKDQPPAAPGTAKSPPKKVTAPKPGKNIPQFRSSIVRVDRVSIPKIAEDSETIDIHLDGIRDPILSPNAGGQGGSREFTFHLSLHDIADRGRRPDQDKDLRSDQLLGEVMRAVHPRPHEAVHTLFRRCCFSLMPTLLAPIGFCIAEMMRFRGRVLALVVSLLPLAMFYVGEFLGARVLHETGNPWSAWMPIALLLVVGVPLCWRQLRR